MRDLIKQNVKIYQIKRIPRIESGSHIPSQQRFAGGRRADN